MKKSLGRRSSSRNPPRTMGPTDFESAQKDRRSGIPVRRAASSDRNMGAFTTPTSRNRDLMTPMSRKRSTSEDRNSMIFSAKGCFSRGTDRPSRSTTLSTNSVRLSSYGGARTKRDNRPIEEKEWQIEAQRKIENFLREDEYGCQLLINGSIKPITLKIFISIVDLLLKKLYGNLERTFIHKENYIIELPFVMRALQYHGKIEKSWLIAVNTARSWCHALACIDFLVSCVTSQLVVDPLVMMFPEKYDNDDDDDDMWNYKLLLPYFQKSYELYLNDHPQYNELQLQLDRQIIEQHISSDNVFERIQNIQSDIARMRQQADALKSQKEEVNMTLQKLDQVFNDLKDEKSKYEEYFQRIKKETEDIQIKRENLDKLIEKLNDDIERKQQSKLEIEKAVANQQISRVQLAELRQKRDSLQREIDRESVYVSKFEELLQQSTLEILSQKKQVNDLIKTYNLEVMKYLSFGLETAMLDGKMGDEEISRSLLAAQEAIGAAKLGLRSLTTSNSQQTMLEAKEELEFLEKNLIEKKTLINKFIDKQNKLCKEKEELICLLEEEISSLTEKLNEVKNSSDLQKINQRKNEEERRAELMERQLSQLRSNAVYYTKECMQILEEYTRKYKEMEEEYKNKLAEC